MLTLTTLLALAACGQSGALYLPTEPAAAQRATLLQTLRFGETAPAPAATASAPAAAASSPTTSP
ncbi:MAG: lipoprotein [Rhodoferax sp.]